MRWVAIAIIVAATTVGEVLQAMGMRRHGEIRDFRPGAIGRALALLARNRFVIGSRTSRSRVTTFRSARPPSGFSACHPTRFNV